MTAAEIAANSSLAKAVKIRGGTPQALADLGFPQRGFVDRISVRARPPTKSRHWIFLTGHR